MKDRAITSKLPFLYGEWWIVLKVITAKQKMSSFNSHVSISSQKYSILYYSILFYIVDVNNNNLKNGAEVYLLESQIDIKLFSFCILSEALCSTNMTSCLYTWKV